MNLTDKLKATVREVKDFPSPGILFKDITPILHDPNLSKEVLDAFANHFSQPKPDAIISIESRGFMWGMLLAQHFGVPFVPVRKKGKLPYETISQAYALEYGTAAMEMHVDALEKDWKVLIHDDLLATGGTANAAAELVKKAGGEVLGFCFLVELGFLNGKEKLKKHSNNIQSLVSY
ncbi:MAG: adenine phosphoribosyltransferase [Candidatus Cyclobacteriaceae bacterium M2_1C_046]